MIAIAVECVRHEFNATEWAIEIRKRKSFKQHTNELTLASSMYS